MQLPWPSSRYESSFRLKRRSTSARSEGFIVIRIICSRSRRSAIAMCFGNESRSRMVIEYVDSSSCQWGSRPLDRRTNRRSGAMKLSWRMRAGESAADVWGDEVTSARSHVQWRRDYRLPAHVWGLPVRQRGRSQASRRDASAPFALARVQSSNWIPPVTGFDAAADGDPDSIM